MAQRNRKQERRGNARPQKVASHHARAEAGGGEGGGREVYVGPGETLENVELEPGQTIRVERGRVLGVTVRDVPDGKIGIYLEDPRGAEVGWCRIDGCAGRGIAASAKEGFDGAKPHIHHNHLLNWRGRPGENVHEGIQAGMTASHTQTRLEALIEHNLLEGVNVESEAISIKSSGNTVRRNTLRRCDRGGIVNRHGRGNTIQANTYEASYGARLLAGPGVYADNQGGRLATMRGSCTQEQLERIRKSPGKKPYPRAEGWRLARNTAKPEVDGNRDERRLEPENNRECGDEIERVEAQALTREMVGPEARPAA